jgi:hypothetical protein
MSSPRVKLHEREEQSEEEDAMCLKRGVSLIEINQDYEIIYGQKNTVH